MLSFLLTQCLIPYVITGGEISCIAIVLTPKEPLSKMFEESQFSYADFIDFAVNFYGVPTFYLALNFTALDV